MKTVKRTAMWMAKEHSMYKAMVRDGDAHVIYNTKREIGYITESGCVSFFYDKDGYVRGMYKDNDGIATMYELKQ